MTSAQILDCGHTKVALTQNTGGQVGTLWFKQSVFSPFTIEFKYKAGGGSGADGLVFMFYKQTGYSPAAGGDLGFIGANGQAIPGYGIEFDNWHNAEYGDPSGNHVALIKDSVSNHLTYVNDIRTEDNQWHWVKVVVGDSFIEVFLDGSSLFSWAGPIARTYGGLGFSAATGGATNWHIIDDVELP